MATSSSPLSARLGALQPIASHKIEAAIPVEPKKSLSVSQKILSHARSSSPTQISQKMTHWNPAFFSLEQADVIQRIEQAKDQKFSRSVRPKYYLSACLEHLKTNFRRLYLAVTKRD